MNIFIVLGRTIMKSDNKHRLFFKCNTCGNTTVKNSDQCKSFITNVWTNNPAASFLDRLLCTSKQGIKIEVRRFQTDCSSCGYPLSSDVETGKRSIDYLHSWDSY